MTPVTISVLVQPRSRRDEIVAVRDGVVAVRVVAPPLDGRANDAVCRWRLRVRRRRQSFAAAGGGLTSVRQPERHRARDLTGPGRPLVRSLLRYLQGCAGVRRAQRAPGSVQAAGVCGQRFRRRAAVVPHQRHQQRPMHARHYPQLGTAAPLLGERCDGLVRHAAPGSRRRHRGAADDGPLPTRRSAGALRARGCVHGSATAITAR